MTHRLTYRIVTLGCRVNHAETREIESVLQDRQLSPAPAGTQADLEIVHTCSVTHTAAAKSRHTIRRAVRRLARSHGNSVCLSNRAPEVIVTGCYASTNGQEAAKLVAAAGRVITSDARDGSTMLARFTARIDAWLGGHKHVRCTNGPSFTKPGLTTHGVMPLPMVDAPSAAGRHIRAELKIQDGCDAHCTFCIIPKIRRTLRSKTVSDAVTEAKQLVALGHSEIVLTGIFIGAYGHETALRRKQQRRDVHPLADLVDAVAHVPGLQRLRISSMEPGDVDERLLDAMVENSDVVVPHLHLPLQSGSNTILKRMNRQYRVDDYLEMIDMVNQALTTDDRLPPAITTDIICGFPGESDEDFEQTAAVAQRVGYLHMHVFPYSRRHGTAAARWTELHVPVSTTRQRVRRLINMEDDPDDGLSVQYRRQLIGRIERVIVEKDDTDRPGHRIGRCDHYVPVSMPTTAQRGSCAEVEIQGLTETGVHGCVIESRTPLPQYV